MEKMASFCFKYKAKLTPNKMHKCRIEIDFVRTEGQWYQVKTYVYIGNKIVDTEHSQLGPYTFIKEIFYKCIEERNIRDIIMRKTKLL